MCNLHKVVVLALYLAGVVNSLPKASSEPAVRAIFLFGDSIVDVGTNNFLNGSLAVANVPFYGIDFPNSTPTGRFSNGYNLGDQLAMRFGFQKSPPPYLYLISNMSIFNETIMQQGVNFASGGSGIFSQTGQPKWKVVVPLEDQIEQFSVIRRCLSELKGPDEANEMLSNSLFIFSAGSNDIFEYFLYKPSLNNPQFVENLRSAFLDYLQNMYDMGARRFGIIGTAPVGCTPFARATNKTAGGNGGCMRQWNAVSRLFFGGVNKSLTHMSSQFPDMKYSLANLYGMSKFYHQLYPLVGLKEIKSACCGVGEYNGESLCYEPSGAKLCDKHDEYLFWDAFHPSEKAANLSADNLFTQTRFAYPINFSQLASP